MTTKRAWIKELRMVSARCVLGLGVIAVALLGCSGAPPASKPGAPAASKPPQGAGAPAAKSGAAPKPSPVPTPAGELVQIGSVTYANWGVRDAAGDPTRELDAGDFYFKGTFIQGEPGQKLTLAIQNVAEQVHNISLPMQGIDRDIPPKSGRVNMEVTFPGSGSVQFFCKYHTARGMNGLLLVGDVPPLAAASPSPVPSSQTAR
jgi:plastocyanin